MPFISPYNTGKWWIFSPFLVWFTRQLIGFKFFDSMMSPCTFDVFLHFPLIFSRSFLMLIFLKLEFSVSSSDLYLCISIAFARFFCFKISDTALYTRAFSSCPSTGRFLAPLEPHKNCSATTIGRPSWLHLFCLYLHHFTLFHIVSRSMQRSHRYVLSFSFKFRIFVSIFFRGFRGLVWPFALHQFGGFVAFVILLGFCLSVVLYPVSRIFPQRFL